MTADIVTLTDGSLQLCVRPQSDSDRTLLAIAGRQLGLTKDPEECEWRMAPWPTGIPVPEVLP